MTLYSGHKTKSIGLHDPRQASARLQEIRRELPVTLAHGRIASLAMDDPAKGLAKIPGLGYHHAYAIMDFDPQSDRLTIWNPWGNHFAPKGAEGPEHGFATEHGIFHIPLATVYKHFSTVHLETTARATADGAKQKSPRHH
jgi:hypothetical protein